MQTHLDDDPNFVADPFADNLQPADKNRLQLKFLRRAVWEPEGERPDEEPTPKSVAKPAKKHQPPPPITPTKTKGDVPASVQPTDDEMDGQAMDVDAAHGRDVQVDDQDANVDDNGQDPNDDDDDDDNGQDPNDDDDDVNKDPNDDDDDDNNNNNKDPNDDDDDQDPNVDDRPSVEQKRSPSPPPPSQPRRSTRNKTPVPRASSALPQTQTSDDVPADHALDAIEEDPEYDVDEIARRSSLLDLRRHSQTVIDDGLSPFSPFSFFPLTFPQIS